MLYATMDFVIYSEPETSEDEDGLVANARKLLKKHGKHVSKSEAVYSFLKPKIMLTRYLPGTNLFGSFMHSAGKYASVYYGYMWGLVLGSDMFA